MKYFLLALLFAGCSEVVTPKVETDAINCERTATVFYHGDSTETFQYTRFEYGIVLDNTGYGFAFMNGNVFVKSILTENIQSIITE